MLRKCLSMEDQNEKEVLATMKFLPQGLLCNVSLSVADLDKAISSNGSCVPLMVRLMKKYNVQMNGMFTIEMIKTPPSPDLPCGQLYKLVSAAKVPRRPSSPEPVMKFWTPQATRCLLAEFRRQQQRFNAASYRDKNGIWKTISEALLKEGHEMGVAECAQKLSNLKFHYKKLKSAENASGAPARMRWEYYDDMEKLFTNDPDTTPDASVASMPSAASTARRSRSRSPRWHSSPPSPGDAESVVDPGVAPDNEAGVAPGTEPVVISGLVLDVQPELPKARQPSGPHAKPLMRWTKQAIHCLLAAYRSHRHRFAATAYRNKKFIWEMVAAMLVEKGHQADAADCSQKMRNLRNRYRKIKNGDMGDIAALKWEYYSEMDDLFRGETNFHSYAAKTPKPSTASKARRSLGRSPGPHSSPPGLAEVEPDVEMEDTSRNDSPQDEETTSPQKRCSSPDQRYEDFVASQRRIFRDLAELQGENLAANKLRTEEIRRRNDMNEKMLEIEVQKLELQRRQLELEERKIESMRKMNEILETTNSILEKVSEKLG